jgi:glycyl-tRNA synthetase beta chain
MDLDLHGSFLEALELIPDSALSAALKPGKGGVLPALDPSRRAALAGELCDFVFDRLRSYYAEQGFDSNQFEAVLAVQPRSLVDFDRRLRAVAEFGRRPEAASLAAANKRVANILRKSESEGGGVPSALDSALFETDAERQLAAELDAARRDNAEALIQRDYAAVLSRLARLQAPVDSFFDSVLVNAEDPAIRANRTALLRQLQDRFTAIADIARL